MHTYVHNSPFSHRRTHIQIPLHTHAHICTQIPLLTHIHIRIQISLLTHTHICTQIPLHPHAHMLTHSYEFLITGGSVSNWLLTRGDCKDRIPLNIYTGTDYSHVYRCPGRCNITYVFRKYIKVSKEFLRELHGLIRDKRSHAHRLKKSKTNYGKTIVVCLCWWILQRTSIVILKARKYS